MRRTKAEAAETRCSILVAAEKLFFEKGVATSTLDEIATAAGVTRGAIYWLELAARQDYADAMHWLARCYLDGNGVAPDEYLGLMWLSKAAAHGHRISQGQLQVMRDRFTVADAE